MPDTLILAPVCSALQLGTQGSWIVGNTCNQINNREYCVFTNPTFHAGQGISIVTTKDRIQQLAAKPVFHNDSGFESSEILYNSKQIEGKGIGVVAKRLIRKGQLIMANSAAVMVDKQVLQGSNENIMMKLIEQSIDMLPSWHREQYLNLSTDEAAKGYSERIFGIFTTNCYRSYPDDDSIPFSSVYTEGKTIEIFTWTRICLLIQFLVSRINHDCRPNAAYRFDPADFRHKVIAASDIMAGEEITVSYIK